MEGRWARLAIRAHTLGALDYNKVSRADAYSLLLEHAVHAELERQWHNERDRNFLIASLGGSAEIQKRVPSLLEGLLRRNEPWTKTEQKLDAESVEDFYHKMVANAREIRRRKREAEEQEKQ